MRISVDGSRIHNNKVCGVLGHFSFTFGGELVGLRKAESEAKPVGTREKRCFDQSKFQLWI